jgi:hypothetical protein
VQEGGLLAGVSYDDGGVASLEMHPHAHNAVATPSSIVPLSTVVSVDVSHDSTGAVVVRRGDVDGDVHFTCLTVGEAERMALTIAASVHVHRIVASRRYWRCVDVLQLVWCGVVWCGVVWCGVVWCVCVAVPCLRRVVSVALCRACCVELCCVAPALLKSVSKFCTCARKQGCWRVIAAAARELLSQQNAAAVVNEHREWRSCGLPARRSCS